MAKSLQWAVGLAIASLIFGSLGVKGDLAAALHRALTESAAREATARRGFTLVEISIVLVIVGLLVGGVVAGRDLIGAAQVRAQISQIEKYQAAMNTFRLKYGHLPGDLPDPAASQFGFVPRGSGPGQGDGNGVIEGLPNSWFSGGIQDGGETLVFWMDLSTAKLIAGSFQSASQTTELTYVDPATNPSLADIYPKAKLGRDNYVSAGSNGLNTGFGYAQVNVKNYFMVSSVRSIYGMGWDTGMAYYDHFSMTVQEAWAIDKKMDDGLPQSGRVTGQVLPAAGAIALPLMWGMTGPDTTATAGDATTCFDNSASASGTPGVNGRVQHYSVEINNGSGLNCALSFQFQ